MRSTDHVIYLTLSPELKSRIRAAAQAEHRSVNAQLRHWIERALEECPHSDDSNTKKDETNEDKQLSE